MKKKIIFIGMIVLALVLTSGTFAFTYTSGMTTLPATLADVAWTTYQLSSNQPDWNSVLPEGETNSGILVPNAEGNYSSIPTQSPDSGDHWDKVDDQPSDEDETYLSTEGSASWEGDLFEITDLASGAEAITSITVNVRFAAAGDWKIRGMTEIITNGQQFSGVTESTSGTEWVTISTQYDTNPSTGEAWTAEEVNALQAGLTLKGSKKDEAAYCTQVYVQVGYEVAGASQGEVPQGDLFNIYPDANYTGDLLVKIYLTNTADLLKAYQYINMKIYVTNSLEAGYTPNFKILSIESGVVEFCILGGTATQYIVSVTGGSYSLVSDNPEEWGSGYSLAPEFYCEISQR